MRGDALPRVSKANAASARRKVTDRDAHEVRPDPADDNARAPGRHGRSRARSVRKWRIESAKRCSGV